VEWQEYQDSLCSGCGQPRHESFAIENDDKYTAEVLRCHACAARERKAYNRNASRDSGQPPMFGEFFAVTKDDD
jgi:predicted Fe-S protein YdhL (DUF1289 family)